MKSKCCEMWQKMSSLDLSKLGHCTHRRGLGWLSTSVAVDLRRCQQFWFCSAKQKWRTPPSLPLCRAPQFSRCCHLQLHGRCHHSQCHLPTHHHQTSTWTALWTLSKAELLEDAWHFGFQFKSCHLSDSRMFLRISYEIAYVDKHIYICILYMSCMKKKHLQLWNKSLRRKISAISWNKKRVCRLKTIPENLGVVWTCWNMWNIFPFAERWFAQRSSCPLPFLFLPPTMAATHQRGVRKCYRPGLPRLVLALHATANIGQWSCAGDADAHDDND